jgi:hypothetical protein
MAALALVGTVATFVIPAVATTADIASVVKLILDWINESTLSNSQKIDARFECELFRLYSNALNEKGLMQHPLVEAAWMQIQTSIDTFKADKCKFFDSGLFLLTLATAEGPFAERLSRYRQNLTAIASHVEASVIQTALDAILKKQQPDMEEWEFGTIPFVPAVAHPSL